MNRTLKLAIWFSVGAFLLLGLAVPLAGTFASAFSEGGAFSLRHMENVFGRYTLSGWPRVAAVTGTACVLLAATGLGVRALGPMAERNRYVRYGRWLLPALPVMLWLRFAGDWQPSDDARRIVTSLNVAAASTLLTVALSLPLAWLSARAEWTGKRWLAPLLLLPMIAPPFVGAIGMKRLLSHFGVINQLLVGSHLVGEPIDFLGSAKFWGVVVMEVLHLYPIMYLNLAAALANIDPTLEEASHSLGAGRARTFARVTLPLAFPGLFAGASIVFIWAFTDLGTPLIFDYNGVAAKRIYDLSAAEQINPAGHALTVVILVLSALFFWLGRKALKSSAATVKVAARARPRTLSRPAAVGAAALFLGVAGIALLPHLAVVLTSVADRWFLTPLPESYTLEHLATAYDHELVSSGVRNSLFYSLGSTGLSLALGLGAAILVARGGGRSGSLLDSLMMVPLAVPGLVLAFGYLGVYGGLGQGEGAPGWMKTLGALVDPRQNPAALLVLGYAVRRIPLVFRSATAGLEQCPQVLEEASWSLGAGPWRTLRKVTVPLIGANLAAGAILAFSYAMLEVSDSMILALRKEFYPITKVIYALFGRIGDGEGVASAMGLLAMALLAASLVSAAAYLGKRMGEMFKVY